MSLAHCQQWLNEASRSNVGPHHIFLVGTKKDLLVNIDNIAIAFIIYNTAYNIALSIARFFFRETPVSSSVRDNRKTSDRDSEADAGGILGGFVENRQWRIRTVYASCCALLSGDGLAGDADPET